MCWYQHYIVNFIQVYDSMGGVFRQLVKSGDDDMRQDAVMQQFFALINSLLAADAATRKRQLQIVTYKVRTLSRIKGQ